MIMRTNREFSGVPAGTAGFVERDGKLWKVTWELPERRGKKPLVDWFDNEEKNRYLECVL